LKDDIGPFPDWFAMALVNNFTDYYIDDETK